LTLHWVEAGLCTFARAANSRAAWSSRSVKLAALKAAKSSSPNPSSPSPFCRLRALAFLLGIQSSPSCTCRGSAQPKMEAEGSFHGFAFAWGISSRVGLLHSSREKPHNPGRPSVRLFHDVDSGMRQESPLPRGFPCWTSLDLNPKHSTDPRIRSPKP
jgi:hypothetical protein